MKNLSIIIALVSILIMMAGCSMPPRGAETQKEETSAEAEVFPLEEAEPAVQEEETAEPEEVILPEEEAGSEATAELGELLDTVKGRYFPGTAGSSLSAAACAAELADFFAETGMDPDTADRAVRDYIAFLPQEDARLFEQQLDGIVGAFSALTGENGEGLLNDCGYAARFFPWSEENVRNCFIAMLGSD